MKVTTQIITALREATGAGLLACKKALEAANGNVEAAIAAMRKAGQVLAENKSHRATKEGLIVISATSDAKRGAILELNCETDFVANNNAFQTFSHQVADLALREKVTHIDDLLALYIQDNQTVEQARQALVAKVGENIQLRRLQFVETVHQLGYYVHKGRYGCLVELKGGNVEIAKNVAIHVVVSDPKDLTELLQQDFYKEPSKTIAQYVEQNDTQVIQYVHFVLGGESGTKGEQPV